MSTDRRPLRPATRVPAPAPARPAAPQRTATSRVPALPPPPARPAVKTATARVAPVAAPARTATGRVPAASPAAQKKTTGRVGRPSPGTARGGVGQAPKNNTMMIVGIAAGALVLIVGLAVAFSGGDSHKAPEPAAKKASAGKPDVSKLERDGISKCEAGLKHIQDGYGSKDKAALEKGVQLISEGNSLLDQANQLSGNGYDTKKYNEALVLARRKLGELRNQ